MDSLEKIFETQYNLDAIDKMSLSNLDFILQGLLMLEVITQKKEWEVGYYYEKIMPDEDKSALLNAKKFLAKLYSIEENYTSESKCDELVRHLPNEISVLKFDEDHFLVFEHGGGNYDNKIRKLRFICKEEFAGIKQVILEQAGRKVQALKNTVQLYESSKEKLSEL